MLLRNGIRIGRPFGIPLLIHGSWFPAAALLVAHFALTVFAGFNPVLAVALGIVSALLFFGCLVAHEMGHALVARGLGIGVRDITLFIFGGVARIAREPSRPAQEIVIALAGPVVSVGIGVSALSLVGDGSGAGSQLLWTIGAANLVLAGFNMLPGFPLDGGRVLRAVLWARSGDLYGATMRAGRLGQSMGVGLALLGLVLFLLVGGPGVQSGAAEGLWLSVVGVFLLILATGTRRAAKLAADVGDETAGRWARPFAGTVAADSALSRLVPDGGPLAVVDDGRLAGVLLPQTLAEPVPTTHVRDLMVPWSPALSFRADRPLTRALERLSDNETGVLILVDDQGAVIGLLDVDGLRERMRTGGRL